jgi:NADH dehydrogenase
MDNLMGSVKVGGWVARMFYILLYRMHQFAVAVSGFFKTARLMWVRAQSGQQPARCR